MLSHRIGRLVIFVLCVSVSCIGCSRDEGEVDFLSPHRICLVSFSKERPAKVLIRITGEIAECVTAPFSNVYTDRDENMIFLRPTISSGLFDEGEGDVCELTGILYGEVTVTDLDVGEYTIVFRGSGREDTIYYGYTSYFLRIEAETVYFFRENDPKRYDCVGDR